MGRSQETFNKKEKEKKRLKKKKEKLEKKLDKKNQEKDNFDDMIAYVDENGQITDTPPDPTIKKKVIKAENIDLSYTREKSEGPTVNTGKLEFFDTSKGFGFIKDADSQEKYFVHISSFQGEIVEGDNVTFDLERGLKGMNAVAVKKV